MHVEQTRLRLSARVGDVPELRAVPNASAVIGAGRLFKAVQGWLLDARPAIQIYGVVNTPEADAEEDEDDMDASSELEQR